jgi:putative aldouronate transport system permease protein
MIITITYFRNSLPEELFDAAAIDGCGNFRFFYAIAIPLSKPIIAVLVVYYGVSHWNAFFNAMMYIGDRKFYPLQLILREILLQNRMVEPAMTESALIDLIERQRYAEMIKYGVIIIASLPVLVIYPFAQKYFVKGVMIGSVKG